MLLARCGRLLVLACSAAVVLPLARADDKGGQPEAHPAAPPAVHSAVAASAKAGAARFVTETLRGRVVWLSEALKRRYDIDTDADAAESSIALESADGRLYPIVKDFRGRGFWLDPRLRGIEIELVARHYDNAPAVQVVRWYLIRQGRRYELDYWCDICAIPMYELKTCDCCQGETRLREQLVEEPGP